MFDSSRLFIGIAFPEEILSRLLFLQEEWKKLFSTQDIRWIPKENLHLTLHFLGSVEISKAEFLKRNLSKISFPEFSFDLNRFLAFPNDREASVIGIGGVEGISPLSSLYHQIGNEMERSGLRVETRMFIPHITLARMIRPLKIEKSILVENLSIQAKAYTLFESKLTSSHPKYIRIKEYELR